MSWLPALLNWKVAALAGAIAIPALLVLYFLKLRRREMPVSSTILWKKAVQELQVNAPFQRLRRNLLLLLQLLILALLIFALARPVVNTTPTPGQTTVILVDRSASMSAKNADGTTRLDEAKRRAKEMVDSMPRDATAMVIAFDDKPEMMQTWTADQAMLRQAIDRVQPTDRKTRLKLTYQLAEAKLFFIPEQNRSNIAPPDVRLFSDGRALDANELSIKSPVTLEKVGDDNAGNVAIVSFSAKRNYERPTQVQVFARLANYGPEPVSSTVTLSVDGETVQTRGANQVYLWPDRWSEQRRREEEAKPGVTRHSDSVEFQLDLTDSAVVKVEQTRKEGDALAADDVAQVVVPPPKQLSVLLVTDGNFFVESAIRSQKQLRKVDVMAPEFYEENKAAAKYDVYVFDRYKAKELPKTAAGFVHIGVVPDGLRVKVARDANGAPVMLDYLNDAAIVLDWNRDHPILRGWSMKSLVVVESLKLEVPLESQVLIDGMKGPLAVLHREASGIHVIFAFDLLQSSWPLMPQNFPAVWYNMMEFLAVSSEMNVRESLEPGATPRISRTSLMKGDSPVKRIEVVDPTGKRIAVDVPETSDFALPALEKVGVYTTDPPVPQYERIAVNLLDPNESNLVPATVPPGGKPEDVHVASGKVRRDLWRYAVMAGIAMLFIEWWVYTRRVHL